MRDRSCLMLLIVTLLRKVYSIGVELASFWHKGRAATRGNPFHIRRREVVVGTDGRPQGSHPHVHILPRPYDTRSGPPECIVGASGVRSGGGGPRGRLSLICNGLTLVLA